MCMSVNPGVLSFVLGSAPADRGLQQTRLSRSYAVSFYAKSSLFLIISKCYLKDYIHKDHMYSKGSTLQ